jgi:hypothetical protein
MDEYDAQRRVRMIQVAVHAQAGFESETSLLDASIDSCHWWAALQFVFFLCYIMTTAWEEINK